MSTAVAVPAATVAGVWHAAAATSADYSAHLLAQSWKVRRGGSRPSRCGVWRRTWQRVDEFSKPDAFTPCDTCRATAVEQPAPAPAAEPVVAAPPTASDEVASRRVVPAATGAQKVWHLLHAEPRRKAHTTLAVCGEPRLRWVDAPIDGTCKPCRICAGLGPDIPQPPPVRIAPAAPRASAHARATVATSAVHAVLVDPQQAAAALPAGWRPHRSPRLPAERDLDGNRGWRSVVSDGTYMPSSHEVRRDQHGRTSRGIPFPPWARLTLCHPINGERVDATPAPTR